MQKSIVYYDGVTEIRRIKSKDGELRAVIATKKWSDLRSLEAAFNALARALAFEQDPSEVFNGDAAKIAAEIGVSDGAVG